MGLNDKAAEGAWKWVADGSNVTYTNWEASSPNDFSSQDCGQLYQREDTTFTWNDDACSAQLWYYPGTCLIYVIIWFWTSQRDSGTNQI